MNYEKPRKEDRPDTGGLKVIGEETQQSMPVEQQQEQENSEEIGNAG